MGTSAGQWRRPAAATPSTARLGEGLDERPAWRGGLSRHRRGVVSVAAAGVRWPQGARARWERVASPFSSPPPPPSSPVCGRRSPPTWVAARLSPRRPIFLLAGGVARFSSTCRYLSPAGPSERAQFVFLFLSPLFFFSGCAATVRPTGAVIDRAPTTRPLYAPATASRALHSRPDPPPSPLFFFVFVAPAPYHAVLALLALLHLPPTPCPRVHSSLLAPSPP